MAVVKKRIFVKACRKAKNLLTNPVVKPKNDKKNNVLQLPKAKPRQKQRKKLEQARMQVERKHEP
ncbi:hypothetical protein F444_06357 [Phytophthora nicotianae P1976]|uniref:Uncharacterized protein n=1 Tax=Phytophthora nicotianae P1976 TaxID=1317066 RepID=A0A081AIU5_PHYNI|nr:hypothetical protein F444_06357 [Phytophthora nicotianae P1976]